MQDGHHELAVVAHHRALTGDEDVRLRPPQPDADAQAAALGGLVDPAGVAGDIEPGMPTAPPARVTSMRELSTAAGTS